MKKKIFIIFPVLFTLFCEKKVAHLQVNSKPPGAAIWLNGESTGCFTNHRFENIYAGFYYLKLTLNQYEWGDTFTLKRKETKVVEVEFPDLKWRYDVGSYGLTSPAIASDGTIYTTSDYLFAISPEGNLKWKFKLESYYSSTLPAIGDDGTIYLLNGNLTPILIPIIFRPLWLPMRAPFIFKIRSIFMRLIQMGV